MKDAKKMTRRRHSAELKAQVLAECAQPGASVARVALAHGINANVVHKWRRLAEGRIVAKRALPEFVPIPMREPVPAPRADIRIELRHGATSMAVTWPVSAAVDCAAWMRELLK
jgi:transposase